MKKGIVGKKIGMTQIFTEDGRLIPVTVIEAALHSRFHGAGDNGLHLRQTIADSFPCCARQEKGLPRNPDAFP